MPELMPFDFDGSPVRVVLDGDGQPWFVAKDVCEVLGISNHIDAVSRLDDDERDGVGITDPIGRQQEATGITESGLYALIFTSRKPEAKRFRKWVTSDVLPSIRKTGRYQAESVALPSMTRALKPALRVTAMNTAVQVVKQCGGDEADIDRLYAKYCAMLAPVSIPESVEPGLSSGWASLIQDWADACLLPDMKSRKQATVLYGLFRSWARGCGYRAELPGMRFWGNRMQERFTKAKIGGLCWYFVAIREQ